MKGLSPSLALTVLDNLDQRKKWDKGQKGSGASRMCGDCAGHLDSRDPGRKVRSGA